MQFRNRIRLPFYISKPQILTTRKVFTKANGSTKTTTVILKKVYDGIVDWIPKEIHERLKIALSHDSINIESRHYVGGVYEDGDYQVAWSDFLDYPIGPASFKVAVTPYDFSNFNCQTCEEALQLSLQDDIITGAYESIDEGDTVTYNIFSNDSICCFPVVAQVMTTDPDYVETATIDPSTGLITIKIKDITPNGNNINLLTYRVTCPNGQYDEADVFANISGTDPVVPCSAPNFLDAGAITEDEATPNWGWTLGAPANVDTFDYILAKADNPALAIDSGNTSEFSRHYDDTLLDPGTCYIFSVRSVCDDLSTSDWININFCTNVSDTHCGQYSVYWSDGTGGTDFRLITYRDCANNVHDLSITNNQMRIICALEYSPGDPVEILGATEVAYLGPCP